MMGMCPNETFDGCLMLVYRQLQLLGEQPVSTIARKTGIKRTTMYYVLERLAELGIVHECIRSNVKHYAPEPLNTVMKVLRNQRKVLAAKERTFLKMCRSLE